MAAAYFTTTKCDSCKVHKLHVQEKPCDATVCTKNPSAQTAMRKQHPLNVAVCIFGKYGLGRTIHAQSNLKA